MIALALIVIAGMLTVIVPCLVVARFMEWRAEDADRRIARLRARRTL